VVQGGEANARLEAGSAREVERLAQSACRRRRSRGARDGETHPSRDDQTSVCKDPASKSAHSNQPDSHGGATSNLQIARDSSLARTLRSRCRPSSRLVVRPEYDLFPEMAFTLAFILAFHES
jgi:hypothetical protein